MRTILGILTMVVGIAAGVFFFVGGQTLASEGNALKTLKSVGGTSVAESYYQSIGTYGVAYSRIAYALGLGIIAISMGLGGNLVSSGSDKREFEHVSSKPLNVGKLTPCPNCQNPCSSEALMCPKCGKTLIESNEITLFSNLG